MHRDTSRAPRRCASAIAVMMRGSTGPPFGGRDRRDDHGMSAGHVGQGAVSVDREADLGLDRARIGSADRQAVPRHAEMGAVVAEDLARH